MYTDSKAAKQAEEINKKTSFPTRPTLLTRYTPNIILFVSYSIYKHDSLSPNTCKLAEGVLTQKKDVTPLQLINAIPSLPVKVNITTREGPFAASKLEYTYCLATFYGLLKMFPSEFFRRTQSVTG